MCRMAGSVAAGSRSVAQQFRLCTRLRDSSMERSVMTVRSVLGLVVVCFASWCVPALAAPADINAEMTPAEAQKILTTTRPRAEKGDAPTLFNTFE